jgi:hypothetical protein
VLHGADVCDVANGGAMSAPKTRSNTFKFVNYTSTDPVNVQNGKVRKQVRSHVSKWQHSQSRARILDAAQTKSLELGTNDVPELCHTASDSTTSSTLLETSAAGQSTHVFAESDAHQAHLETRDDNVQQDPEALDTEATLFSPEACRLASSGLTKAFSQGVMSIRTVALQDSENIIGISLNDMQLELSSVMSLYKNICEVQAPDFARQYSINDDQASWGRFYSFVWTDPILLSTAVLLGVRNQLDVLGRCIDGQTFASVLHIERFLMQSINAALGDPVRSISDQMLIAVALCAAYEIKHGSGACYHVHMQGLVQMINLRGGLLAIGSPDPYIVRLLIWIDTNTSKLAGCRPYLRGMANGLTAHPNANTTIFRARGVVSP